MMDYKRLYKTWSGTIPAGGSVKISMGGFYIRFLESDATGLIAVNDGDPGVAVGGLGLSLPDGFENFRLTNPTGSDWTVTVGVSEGTIEDSRLNVPSGIDVNIASDPQGSAILAMLQNSDDQRSSVNVFGASYACGACVTSPVMLIDPSSNTNGAILRTFSAFNNSFGSLHCDTSAPTGYADYSKRLIYATSIDKGADQPDFLPLNVPSGYGVWFSVSVAGGVYSATWDYK